MSDKHLKSSSTEYLRGEAQSYKDLVVFFEETMSEEDLAHIAKLESIADEIDLLRDTLVHIQHHTSCTSTQFDLIEKTLKKNES